MRSETWPALAVMVRDGQRSACGRARGAGRGQWGVASVSDSHSGDDRAAKGIKATGRQAERKEDQRGRTAHLLEGMFGAGRGLNDKRVELGYGDC